MQFLIKVIGLSVGNVRLVRPSEIKFVLPHMSLPGNFRNFDYKYFRIDRFLANNSNKEIKTINSEFAAFQGLLSIP